MNVLSRLRLDYINMVEFEMFVLQYRREFHIRYAQLESRGINAPINKYRQFEDRGTLDWMRRTFS